MIFGTGVDIVEISRIAKIIDKWGTGFAEKILAENELATFLQLHQQKPDRAINFLAKRFASKEACAKAFGTGFRQGLAFTHIMVEHDDLGKPLLAFQATAQAMYQHNKIVNTHLSLSDEQRYVVAFVILEI